MLMLETENQVHEFPPGAVVRGRCGWELDEIPRDAFLRLFWYTEGRGTQDIAIVEELPLTPETPSHQQDFQFNLPISPYTFSGTLIALRWALELALNKGKESARLDLLVSPWETEVVLKPFKDTPG